MNRLALLASCLVVLGACDKKGDAPKAAAGDGGGDKPAAAGAPAAKPIGLNDPGNDPKCLALAKKALECKFDNGKFGSFDSNCADWTAWRDNKKEAYHEPTLIALLEDPDEKVRHAGAKKLSDDLGILTDKELAARALAVAEKSKTPREQADLGYIVGRIKLEGTDLFPRIKALLNSKDTDPNMRVGITASLLRKNPTNQDAFTLMRESVNNPDFDKNVQRTALGSFSWPEVMPSKCDVFLENIEKEDADHAGDAVQMMTRAATKCEAHFDAVLKSIEARIKAKTATSTFFPTGLGNICDPKGAAKPPQVKKALGFAHKLAEDKTLEGRVRAEAIDASFKCDPKGGKAYLGKFKKETDADIKETLARIARLEEQKKKKK